MIFQYFLPTRIVFGRGTVAALPDYLRATFPEVRSIQLVCGRRFFRESGMQDRFTKILEHYDLYLFDEVESGPTSETLENALAMYRQHKPDLILGVGGGSVMDLAKAVAILARNNGKLEEYQKGKAMEREAVPYVAVPTTSGTASEMTVWSVIINREGAYAGKRKSFSDPKMYPRLAVIDPDLTRTLPPKATVGTALDILSASVESMWSRQRNPISSIFAKEAIRLCRKHLPAVYASPDNADERARLCLASLYCGFAVSNSRTNAPHKVSYPLSTHYGVPHGAACALTLPYFLEYIGQHEPELLTDVQSALDANSPSAAAEQIRQFVASVGMPNRLGELGITENDLPRLVDESYVPVEKQEDPVPLSKEDFTAVLRSAL